MPGIADETSAIPADPSETWVGAVVPLDSPHGLDAIVPESTVRRRPMDPVPPVKFGYSSDSFWRGILVLVRHRVDAQGAIGAAVCFSGSSPVSLANAANGLEKAPRVGCAIRQRRGIRSRAERTPNCNYLGDERQVGEARGSRQPPSVTWPRARPTNEPDCPAAMLLP